jgi:hypothetical protein
MTGTRAWSNARRWKWKRCVFLELKLELALQRVRANALNVKLNNAAWQRDEFRRM